MVRGAIEAPKDAFLVCENMVLCMTPGVDAAMLLHITLLICSIALAAAICFASWKFCF